MANVSLNYKSIILSLFLVFIFGVVLNVYVSRKRIVPSTMKNYLDVKYLLPDNAIRLVDVNTYTDTFDTVPTGTSLKREPKPARHFMDYTFYPLSKGTNLPFRTIFTKRYHVTDASCEAIIDGNATATNNAIRWMDKFNRTTFMSSEDYLVLTTNCTAFRHNRNYITESLMDIERDFPLAFSMVVYKDIEQVERLLRAIYRPQNVYCIHVDKKTPVEMFNAVSSIAKCFNNVFVTSKRSDVQWGEFSVLEPELACMEELWNKSKTWKYFINLTGQEFPLRTNYELVKILQVYNGSNDVEAITKKANRERWKKAGKPPHNIVPTKGSVHVVLSRGFVDFALHDKRAQDFLNWTRQTEIPDETFFASLNHNPHLGVPGAYKGIPETDETLVKPFLARYKHWRGAKCEGKFYHNICIIGVGDLPSLSRSRALVVNKLHLDFQHLALDCLEELIFNRTRDEYLGVLKFDPGWYSSLGFVHNKV